MQIKAAVVSERSGPFVIDTLELCAPRPEELIVRVVASGMCQTICTAATAITQRPIRAFMGTKAPAWFMPSAARCAPLRPAITS